MAKGKLPELNQENREPLKEEIKGKGEDISQFASNSEDYNLEVITDYYGRVDPTYLEKRDPNFVYRYLRSDFKNLSVKTGNLLHQQGGWQLVPREHLIKKLGIRESFLSPDGMYRVGDLVLAFMPKGLFEKKEKYKDEKANSPMKSIKRLLKEGDAKSGGRDIHETMKGIQTKKSLGM